MSDQTPPRVPPDETPPPVNPTRVTTHETPLRFDDATSWERWLEAHHAERRAAWLQIAKRGRTPETVTHAQALGVALCFGWIDAQRRSLDADFFLQRFTVRGPRSRWSQVNREAALSLIAAGRMRAAGQAQIDAARADGRWERAYPPQSTIAVPADLQRALEANPEAGAFFATLTGQARYAFLYRLHNVTTERARQRRIASYIELLSQRRTLT